MRLFGKGFVYQLTNDNKQLISIEQLTKMSCSLGEAESQSVTVPGGEREAESDVYGGWSHGQGSGLVAHEKEPWQPWKG